MVMQKDVAYPTLTQPDDLPPPRERTESGIRLRPSRTGFSVLLRGPAGRRESEPPAASDILQELSDAQVALTKALIGAQALVAGIPRDPSAHAAAQSIRERIADLNELRTALAAVNLDACDPRTSVLFTENAPLTEYMRGLYVWVQAVLRALDELASGLRVLAPDWSLLRARLEDSTTFYLTNLEKPIARAATQLRLRLPEINDPSDPLSEFDEHLIYLFWASSHLARNLEERFG
jgi:hypothetical protein